MLKSGAYAWVELVTVVYFAFLNEQWHNAFAFSLVANTTSGAAQCMKNCEKIKHKIQF